MVKKYCYTLLAISFSLFANRTTAQVSAEFVENNAVEIKDRTASNDTLYKSLKDYRAIMLGEIHGTQEPTEFLIGIVKSLANNGKKVIVGLEISSDGLGSLSQETTVESLKKTPFFNSVSLDGRQCIAWAEMIVALKKLNIETFCFDIDTKSNRDMNVDRDSMQYVNINNTLKTDTNKVLITLTGNIGNRLVPYKKAKTLACYIQNDKNSCLKNKKLLSLNYMYGKGTTMNWMNDGFKLRDTDGNAMFYEYATPFDNYLFIYPITEEYNGIIFSKTVTASKPLVEKK